MTTHQKRAGLVVQIGGAFFGLLLSSSASAVPVQYSVNGHYYDTVLFAQNTSWTTAKASAEALNGYLLTVTSAGEQDFVANFVFSTTGTGAWWAGGSDADVEGEWRWQTGPETGRQFWQGDGGGSPTGPDNYAKWFSGEPNSTSEDYMSWNINSSTINGWNDVGVTNSIIRGYIIEFDQNPANAPEPATLTLLAIGLFGAGYARKRRLH